MKPTRLQANNFLSIGSLDFPFEKGLVLITGENLDAPKASSNGAGKSSILEAIAWCLWGETIRGLKTDSVVNERVGKDCKVQLTLQENSSTYDIIRTRKCEKDDKPNDLRFLVNGKDCTKSTVIQTQKQIDQLLGMDFPIFCALMPGAGVKVASLSDGAVKQLLERLLHTEELDVAYREALQQCRVIRENLKEARTFLLSSQENIMAAKARISSIDQSHKTFTDKKTKKLQELNAKREEIIQSFEYTRDAIKDLQVNLQAESALTSELKDLETQKKDLDDEYKFRYDLYTSQKVEYMAEKKDLERTISQEQKLLEVEVEDQCPTCLQPCTEEYKEVLRQERLASIETKQAKLVALKKPEAPEKAQNYSSIIRDIEAVKSGLRELERTKNTLSLKTKELSLWQKMLDENTEAIRKVKKEKNPFQDILDQEKQKLEELEKTSKLYTEQVKDLATKEYMYSFWTKGFSPQGIRSLLLSSVVPILNKRAEYYCATLTNKELTIKFKTKTTLKSGKTSEKFNIEVKYLHGASSWKGSSAGEKARADLIIALCLGDLANMCASNTLSFRFFDEPFENVDEAGVEAINVLLNQQVEDHHSVYVVTHNSAFAQLFSKTVNLVKEHGFTRCEQ